MKRKVAWLLALAVPLVGLILVWRVGQRARAEAEVYAAVLHYIVNRNDRPEHCRAFVSIKGHDPSALLCQLMQDQRIEVLPASAYGSVYEPSDEQTLQIRFWGLQWQSTVLAKVAMEADHDYRAELLHGRWNVSRSHELTIP